MIQFFQDRTGIAISDMMYPTRIQHETPKDLFSLWFTDGEYTSRTINAETFPMTVCDGQPLLSACHTFPDGGSQTWTNILTNEQALDVYSFYEACRLLWMMRSIPDTIITSTSPDMLAKAREIQEHYRVKFGWELEHVVIPQLKGMSHKWRWFVADSRKATGHYKKLPAGFSEVCVFTFDWIVGSLCKTAPCIE